MNLNFHSDWNDPQWKAVISAQVKVGILNVKWLNLDSIIIELLYSTTNMFHGDCFTVRLHEELAISSVCTLKHAALSARKDKHFISKVQRLHPTIWWQKENSQQFYFCSNSKHSWIPNLFLQFSLLTTIYYLEETLFFLVTLQSPDRMMNIPICLFKLYWHCMLKTLTSKTKQKQTNMKKRVSLFKVYATLQRTEAETETCEVGSGSAAWPCFTGFGGTTGLRTLLLSVSCSASVRP